MTDRKRKKQARKGLWQNLCVLADSAGPGFMCHHATAYDCLAQDRHTRRVLGETPWWHWDRRLLIATLMQNQPPPLWMGHGARHHQRYRNRRRGR